jgi:hypothetical protein
MYNITLFDSYHKMTTEREMHEEPVQQSTAPQRRSSFSLRNFGFASAAMFLAGCTPISTVSDDSFNTDQTHLSSSPEPAPSPLSEGDALVEKDAYRMLIDYAASLRADRILRDLLVKGVEKSVGEEKSHIVDQVLQCQLKLELNGFAALRCIQSTNPRCWPRLVKALQAMSGGSNPTSRTNKPSIEKWGHLTSSVDDPAVMSLLRPLYRQQAEFIAIAIGRMDLSIRHTKNKLERASQSEKNGIDQQLHDLVFRRNALLKTINNGDLFPNTPVAPESLRKELLEHFLKFRHASGGLPKDHPTQPLRIEFGSGAMPPLQLNILNPSESPQGVLPSVPNEGELPDEPKKDPTAPESQPNDGIKEKNPEKPRKPRKNDNRPQNA